MNQDDQYMQAVKSGDLAQAQALVLEAARAKGYCVAPVYHGTGERFTRFNLNKAAQGIFWFAENRDKILRGESGAQGITVVMSLCLKIDKVAGWSEYDKMMLAEMRQAGFGGARLDDDYFVFDPKHIKSLEPVTYFKRKVILLSQRFDDTKDDIRF